MSMIINPKIQRIEGNIKVIKKKDVEYPIRLQSDQRINIQRLLNKQYPLTAIQITQQLSASSGVSHGIVATLALEDALQIKPTITAQKVRQMLLQLSTLHTHIHHFYWKLLPNYLNRTHKINHFSVFHKLIERSFEEGDLPKKEGKEIWSHLLESSQVLYTLQKMIATLGGKFPIIMNLIPSGITNHTIEPKTMMKLSWYLSTIKNFIEKVWSQDVILFFSTLPSTQIISKTPLHLISFGSLPLETGRKIITYHSPGVYLDKKLEPFTYDKISKSFIGTYYESQNNKSKQDIANFTDFTINLQKKDAYTWIPTVRYDTEVFHTGSLARILITHFAGGNPEFSDQIRELLKNSYLNLDNPNCLATRLISKVFEARFLIKDLFHSFDEFDHYAPLNKPQNFDFKEETIGIGKLEAPAGSILHRVKIKKNQIQNYEIISPGNWNLSPIDEQEKLSVVEFELNEAEKNKTLNEIESSRIVHSYDSQVLEATL